VPALVREETSSLSKSSRQMPSTAFLQKPSSTVDAATLSRIRKETEMKERFLQKPADHSQMSSTLKPQSQQPTG